MARCPAPVGVGLSLSRPVSARAAGLRAVPRSGGCLAWGVAVRRCWAVASAAQGGRGTGGAFAECRLPGPCPEPALRALLRHARRARAPISLPMTRDFNQEQRHMWHAHQRMPRARSQQPGAGWLFQEDGRRTMPARSPGSCLGGPVLSVSCCSYPV